MTTPSPRARDLVIVLRVGQDPLEQLPLVLDALEPSVAANGCPLLVVDPEGRDEVRRCVSGLRGVELREPVRRPSPGGAINGILKAEDFERAIVLSTDCVPDPEWLEALVHASDAHPEAAFVASRVVFHYSPGTIRSAGVTVDGAVTACWRGFRRPAAAYDRVEPVLAPCRDAALYRRTLFETAGYLDEVMGDLYGDADLGLRALLFGHGGLYTPEATCRYRVQPTPSAAEMEDAYAAEQRDRAALAFKNLPTGLLLRLLPWHLSANLRELRRAWRRRQVRAFLRGRLRFWEDFSPLLRHRRRLLFDPRSRFDRLRALFE